MKFIFDVNIVIILLTGILGVVRYRHIHKSYYPFIYFIWAGGINEILSLVLIHRGYSNLINNNIYVLFEALLLLYFFRKLKIFKKNRALFMALIAGIIITWLIENIIYGKIQTVSEYFRIIYSFIIVLLSVTTINV